MSGGDWDKSFFQPNFEVSSMGYCDVITPEAYEKQSCKITHWQLPETPDAEN